MKIEKIHFETEEERKVKVERGKRERKQRIGTKRKKHWPGINVLVF